MVSYVCTTRGLFFFCGWRSRRKVRDEKVIRHVGKIPGAQLARLTLYVISVISGPCCSYLRWPSAADLRSTDLRAVCLHLALGHTGRCDLEIRSVILANSGFSHCLFIDTFATPMNKPYTCTNGSYLSHMSRYHWPASQTWAIFCSRIKRDCGTAGLYVANYFTVSDCRDVWRIYRALCLWLRIWCFYFNENMLFFFHVGLW